MGQHKGADQFPAPLQRGGEHGDGAGLLEYLAAVGGARIRPHVRDGGNLARQQRLARGRAEQLAEAVLAGPEAGRRLAHMDHGLVGRHVQLVHGHHVHAQTLLQRRGGDPEHLGWIGGAIQLFAQFGQEGVARLAPGELSLRLHALGDVHARGLKADDAALDVSQRSKLEVDGDRPAVGADIDVEPDPFAARRRLHRRADARLDLRRKRPPGTLPEQDAPHVGGFEIQDRQRGLIGLHDAPLDIEQADEHEQVVQHRAQPPFGLAKIRGGVEQRLADAPDLGDFRGREQGRPALPHRRGQRVHRAHGALKAAAHDERQR